MFKLQINTDGAAFRNETDGSLDAYGWEVRRLLVSVVDDLLAGQHAGTLVDYNGNRVGSWEYVG